MADEALEARLATNFAIIAKKLDSIAGDMRSLLTVQRSLNDGLSRLNDRLKRIEDKEDTILDKSAELSDLVDQLGTDIGGMIDRAKAELLAELNNNGTPDAGVQAVEDKMNALKTKVEGAFNDAPAPTSAPVPDPNAPTT